MKAVSDTMELKDDLENDLALAMIIERRHSGKIGSVGARELIEKIKLALGSDDVVDTADFPTQVLSEGFPFH